MTLTLHFDPNVSNVPCVPAGWFDDGTVRANVFWPDAATFGRGPYGWHMYVDYSNFSDSNLYPHLDSGDTPAQTLLAINNGRAVIMLRVHEAGDTALAGRGLGLAHPMDHAFSLDPKRPTAFKDVWGAFTWFKRYGHVYNLDKNRGCTLQGGSAGAITCQFIGMAATRGGGRYPALETDACLAEEDSRPDNLTANITGVRFRTYTQTLTAVPFPDSTSGPTFEVKGATLAATDNDYQDAYSPILTTTTFTTADHEAAARIPTYMAAATKSASSSYFANSAGDFVNNVDAPHTEHPLRMWRNHYGRVNTRTAVGTSISFNSSFDSISLDDPVPLDGTESDWLTWYLRTIAPFL